MVPLIKTLDKRINSIQQQIQQLIWLDSLHTYDIYFFIFVVDPDSWDFIIKFVKFSFSLHNDIIATLLCLVKFYEQLEGSTSENKHDITNKWGGLVERKITFRKSRRWKYGLGWE